MRYLAAMIIRARRMIHAWAAHAKGHRSSVLNARLVMELAVRPILVSVSMIESATAMDI